MEIVRCWEEVGVTIKDPYKRHIKVFLAPDNRNVPEISFNQAIIYPQSQTDYHIHDRPELIYVVTGRGISICDGVEEAIQADKVLWIRAGEKHQIINTGAESIKIATLFVPGYTRQQSYQRCIDAAQEAEVTK